MGTQLKRGETILREVLFGLFVEGSTVRGIPSENIVESH